MINFDSLTLNEFAKENYEFFLGAKIQKIQQPNRSELIFSIRNKGDSRKFYINFNPEFYHLCFMSKENEKLRNIVIPKTAPMFCMLLRKYIQNAKILNILVPKNERIFEIYFEYFDELNEKSQLCLAVELMGKHSNVILYNYETNVIIGCAHNVSSEKSRERELSGLMPYIYPPKQKKKNLLKVSFDSFVNKIDESDVCKSISSEYNYLTFPIVSEFYNNLQTCNFEKLYNNLRLFLLRDNYSYNISNDFSKYFLFDIQNSFKYENVNDMIDSYFSFHQNKFIKENLRCKIIKQINQRLKKLQLLKEKQQEQINKFENAIIYKNKADIIMSNIYKLKYFSDKLNINDFEGNNIQIDMDINLSASDNANRYYSLYKKAKASFEHSKLMIDDTESQILYYEEQLFFAQTAVDIKDLEEINEEITNERESVKEKNIIISSIDYNGYRIFIGKNKKQNDYILSKIASSEDLWFHPLNAPGAHILVKCPDKETVPDSVLLKAAQITKEYSSQKDNSKTSVIYTKRKYVKKANNKIAFVTYKNEVEIVV